jgi:polar amino acid transport system permease protein
MTVWDWDYAWEILPDLAKGLLITVEVTLTSAALALVAGLALAFGARSRNVLLKAPLRLALEFIRGTPLIVQLFFAFYVMPQFGLTASPFVVGTVVLGLHYSCYMAEAYRASIDALPAGQWEAAIALNLPRRRTWMAVILPQAVRNAVPALTTYVIAMYKETALLFAIGLPVLLFEAREEGIQTFRYLEPYTIAGILYLLVSYPTALLARRLESRTVRHA